MVHGFTISCLDYCSALFTCFQSKQSPDHHTSRNQLLEFAHTNFNLHWLPISYHQKLVLAYIPTRFFFYVLLYPGHTGSPDLGTLHGRQVCQFCGTQVLQFTFTIFHLCEASLKSLSLKSLRKTCFSLSAFFFLDRDVYSGESNLSYSNTGSLKKI